MRTIKLPNKNSQKYLGRNAKYVADGICMIRKYKEIEIRTIFVYDPKWLQNCIKKTNN